MENCSAFLKQFRAYRRTDSEGNGAAKDCERHPIARRQFRVWLAVGTTETAQCLVADLATGNWLTNSVVGPSWEANSSSPSQEILSILWNLEITYRQQKGEPFLLFWARLIQSTPSHVFIAIFNIILSVMPRFFQLVYFLQLSPPKFCIHFSSPHTCHMPHPSHATRCNCSGDIWWTVKITKFLTMQFSPAFCHFLPLSPKYIP